MTPTSLGHLSFEILEAHRARLTLKNWEWAGHGTVLHSDPFTRLYWVNRGEGYVRHHGRTFNLRPGRLFVIPANSPGYYGTLAELDLSWCHFRAPLLGRRDFFELYRCHFERRIPPEQRREFSNRWSRLIAVAVQDDLSARWEADCLLRLLLLPIVRTADADTVRQRNAGMERLRPVLEFIDAHAAEIFPLKRLAQVAKLQTNYFSNVFTQSLGVSPRRYIMWRKIHEAQLLLRSTGLSMKEIAHRTGFRNEYYFSRVFKRLSGIAPSLFRTRRLEPDLE